MKSQTIKRICLVLMVLSFFMVTPLAAFADTVVDGTDLAEFIQQYQAGNCAGGCTADFDGNGVVDAADLTQLAKNFGRTDYRALVGPSLTLMVSTNTDSLALAWLPGSDGVTPDDAIAYEVHLSTQEQFTPGSATLVKTVTGVRQATVEGLSVNTTYYGVVVAVFPGNHKSAASSPLQTRTYPAPVVLKPATVVKNAADLGLGAFTTADDSTYVFTSNTGNLPEKDSVLFAEDMSGRMTLRRVASAEKTNGVVTVGTTAASLTDVFNRASFSSSFHLVDVQQQAQALTASSKGVATSQTMTTLSGSQYSRIDWKDRLLSAEQTQYAHTGPGLTVVPQGQTSAITLSAPSAASSSFTASVTAAFAPTLITEAQWGGSTGMTLDSAKVAAKGILSLTADAAYNFSAASSVNQDFKLFDKTWTSFYPLGTTGLFVFQEVTLTVNVEASAVASAQVDAQATASVSETVEVGATYDGATWTPYIVHSTGKGMTASLDIAGEASGEIRLIPEVTVTFYTVLSSSLTVEPFVGSELTFAETTNNLDFLAAHPDRLIQITSFDAALGMESNINVNLSMLGLSWDILPITCILGTDGSCRYQFPERTLFSLPELTLDTTSTSATDAQLRLQVTDGTANPFDAGSVQWEAFPSGATLQPGPCSRSGDVTTCTATLTFSTENEYTVFASGQGLLGPVGRQFKEMTVSRAAACGAYVAPGVWKEFDCYNLGAPGKPTGDDPFTPSWRLIGNYWQWGRKSIAAPGPTGPDAGSANSGAINGWDTTYAPNGSWSDASKTVNDPCPAGYRVPTQSQWYGVVINNPQSIVGTWSTSRSDHTNYSAARFLGNGLMLPAAGYRSNGDGSLGYRGYDGLYWSSTGLSSGNGNLACNLFSRSYGAFSGSSRDRPYGLSVRCIEE
ncbi:MAG: hypothetical protein WC836_15800 [Desulfobacula sp.]